MPRRYLQFEFEVGEVEPHLVAFRFDLVLGPLDITVDGRRVVSKLDTFSLRRVERYGLCVGRRERHDVLIEKVRKPVVGGLLPQECWAYVDGRLIGRFTNSTSRPNHARPRARSARPLVTRRSTPSPPPLPS